MPAPSLRQKPKSGTWGESLAERMARLNVNQAQLESLCEEMRSNGRVDQTITQQTISKVIHSTILPREKTRALLARLLGTSVPELFPWERYEATEREVAKSLEKIRAQARARQKASAA